MKSGTRVSLSAVLMLCFLSSALAFQASVVTGGCRLGYQQKIVRSTSGGWSSSNVRLSGVRDDCKSCREQALREEEANEEGLTAQERVARALGKEIGTGENITNARAAFEEENRAQKVRNAKIAAASFLSSVALFFFQHSAISPAAANPVVLLRAMETTSAPLATALTNGKPTVVDFYADWCENCKAMAPLMKEVEETYRNQINFVVIDGNSQKNYDLVDAFRVDGIPHLAMVNKNGDVETSIVGAVPKEVIEADIKALIAGAPLPYEGFDMFEGENHNVRGEVIMEG